MDSCSKFINKLLLRVLVVVVLSIDGITESLCPKYRSVVSADGKNMCAVASERQRRNTVDVTECGLWCLELKGCILFNVIYSNSTCELVTELSCVQFLYVNRCVAFMDLDFGSNLRQNGEVLRSNIFPARNLTISADDTYRIYYNGAELTNIPIDNNWDTPNVIDLPCTVKVIAVKGINGGDGGGIIASTDDRFVLSNSSWKCTNVEVAGWQNVSFDDHLWSPAYEIQPYYNYASLSAIRKEAYWIWTSHYDARAPNPDNNIFCRLKL